MPSQDWGISIFIIIHLFPHIGKVVWPQKCLKIVQWFIHDVNWTLLLESTGHPCEIPKHNTNPPEPLKRPSDRTHHGKEREDLR